MNIVILITCALLPFEFIAMLETEDTSSTSSTELECNNPPTINIINNEQPSPKTEEKEEHTNNNIQTETNGNNNDTSNNHTKYQLSPPHAKGYTRSTSENNLPIKEKGKSRRAINTGSLIVPSSSIDIPMEDPTSKNVSSTPNESTIISSLKNKLIDRKLQALRRSGDQDHEPVSITLTQHEDGTHSSSFSSFNNNAGHDGNETFATLDPIYMRVMQQTAPLYKDQISNLSSQV